MNGGSDYMLYIEVTDRCRRELEVVVVVVVLVVEVMVMTMVSKLGKCFIIIVFLNTKTVNLTRYTHTNTHEMPSSVRFHGFLFKSQLKPDFLANLTPDSDHEWAETIHDNSRLLYHASVASYC
jgi:hypothetical protein